MPILTLVLIAIGGVIFLLAAIAIYYYNKFIRLENIIDNSLSQIDVQLRKRADLVPNLINTVKGYAKHERKIMNAVTNARKEFLKAQETRDIKREAKAGAELQNALKSVFAIAENYPQLKANENFLELQRELSAIENRIAYARQAYNDSILSFNNSVETFPAALFAKIYNKKEKEFLQIPAEARAVPKVEF